MSGYTRREMLQASVAAALGPAGMAQVTASGNPPALSGEIPKAPPPIKKRMFWTWDHSTEWALNRPGAQTMGASNFYGRSAEVFVQDYTRLIEWCGRHGVDAVVIWGLLRDPHGGLETARGLCDVAAKQGVRILCGVGLNSYGGVYYEGNSPYSLEMHLKAHPDLYALDASGNKMIFNFGASGPKYTHHACPSRPENQEFAAESLRWLFKSLPLGGVQMETGDTGVCQCRLCKKRRQHPASQFSWEDMALMYPIATAAIRSVSPDARIVCETYSHPEPHPEPQKPPRFGEGKPAWADEFLAEFPEGVSVQWVCDEYIQPRRARAWTQAGSVSSLSHHNIMRAHFSTYWMGHLRAELSIDWIADMVQQSVAHGFDSISLFGEVSPFHAGAELNYLALENYGSASNSKADLDTFLRDVAAPLLGGENRARDYLRYARLLDQRAQIPGALEEMYACCASLQPETARRWVWLANYLASFSYS